MSQLTLKDFLKGMNAMISMQYKIKLPDSFDMNIIRERVRENGHKMDGFKDLLFKAYLISVENSKNDIKKEYAPLYLWKDSVAMNQFIWDGFYDNILKSFGWQTISTAIPLTFEKKENFNSSRYCLEITREISESTQMEQLSFSSTFDNSTSQLLVYNPEKWQCKEYYFFEELPEQMEGTNFYEILHLSLEQ